MSAGAPTQEMVQSDDSRDPAVAFEGISRRLAGLTAAVEGMAARQQELHARDYSTELGQILETEENVVGAVNSLAKRPAMALTPEDIGCQIENAGRSARKEDRQALEYGYHQLRDAIGKLDGMVASALNAEKQWRQVEIASAVAAFGGFLLACILPGALARTAPASWQWPERMAAGILHQNQWSAGARLMRGAAPDRWREMAEADRLVGHNRDALAACQVRTGRSKKPLTCEIELLASGNERLGF